ncbi:hypothetical protein HNP77_001375 [Treponema rectale]|nr:hypothetical protein [Treponema rectale]MBB5219006.1 hypothetical protein [Treponema rectale]
MKKILFLLSAFFLLESCTKKNDDSKKEESSRFELNDPGSLNTEDINHLGMTDINSFEELHDRLSSDQKESIDLFELNGIDIHSFKGLEEFENLIIIDLTDCLIESFEDVAFSKKAERGYHSLYCYNCSINNIDSISKMDTLSELKLSNCSFTNHSFIKLSEKLKDLHLESCPDYKKFFNVVYPNLQVLCLRDNNICQKDELEKILEKCPAVEYIYLGDNPIYEQIKDNVIDMGKYSEMIFENCIQ